MCFCLEYAVRHLPKIFVLDTTVDSLCHGADLGIPGISLVESGIQEGFIAAMMTLKGELVAIGTAKMFSKDMIKKEKGIAVKINKVFMLPGVYPKMSK